MEAAGEKRMIDTEVATVNYGGEMADEPVKLRTLTAAAKDARIEEIATALEGYAKTVREEGVTEMFLLMRRSDGGILSDWLGMDDNALEKIGLLETLKYDVLSCREYEAR